MSAKNQQLIEEAKEINVESSYNTRHLILTDFTAGFITKIILFTILWNLTGVCCQTCTNNDFSIIHGTYLTTYFGNDQLYNLEFCSVLNPQAYRLALYPDGNLAVAYHAYNTFVQNNFNTTEIFAKIDHLTGKTLWAKLILVEFNSYPFNILDFVMMDSFTWIFTGIETTSTYYGGIVKLDADGNTLISKVFSNSFFGQGVEMKYFQSGFMAVVDNTNFVVNGLVNNIFSSISFTEDSYIDQLTVNIDINGTIRWATVLDYNLSYESLVKMATYNSSIIYSGLYAAYKYPCFVSLNSTNGNLIKGNIYNYISNVIGETRWINVHFATSKYVFAGNSKKYRSVGVFKGLTYRNSCVFILNRITLEPLRVFNTDNQIFFNVTDNTPDVSIIDLNTISLYGTNLNVKYLNNTDIFHDSSDLVNTTEMNITACLWPSYIKEIYTCSPPFPDFKMLKNYTFPIGSGIKSIITYTPFDHCQNSRFLIRVCLNNPSINGSCTEPSWITVNQSLSTVDLNSGLLTSVGIRKVYFQVQMIVFSCNQNYPPFIQEVFSTDFEFTNQNCILSNTPLNWYLVINELKNYTLAFTDSERDIVSVKILSSEGINVFVKNSNSTSVLFLMQCEDDTVKSSSLVISYTDNYHTSSVFWSQATINIAVYQSDPPYFVTPLDNLTVNLCSSEDYTYILPNVVDPKNYSVTIEIADNAYNWIQIVDNSKLVINRESIQIGSISNLTISLMLTNSVGVSISYPINITFVSSTSTNLGPFVNMKTNIPNPILISLPVDIRNLTVVSCIDGMTINWICFSDKTHQLNIFNPSQCNFTIDECNSDVYIGTYCVKLSAYDSCNHNIQSNEFNVTLKPALPPSISNILGPLTVYQNYYLEVVIPDYLFYSKNALPLNLNSTSCIIGNNILVATRIDSIPDEGGNILYIKAFEVGKCQISIYTSNTYCQSSEVLVEINVAKCASSLCLKCQGPYESDCLECINGFVLGDNNSCLPQSNFLPTSQSKFYWICGLLLMISLIFSIILSLKFGKFMLEPVVHVQTLMIFSAIGNFNEGWREYLSWVMFIKFDFAFLNSNYLERLAICNPSYSNLSNINFYCEETIVNYSNLILFVFTILAIKFCLKLKFVLLSKILAKLERFYPQPQTSFWIIWFVILPFLLINIYYDLLSIRSHLLPSLISLIFLLFLSVYSILKRFEFLQNNFIVLIDPLGSTYYTYLCLL